nr:oxyopinin 9 precursor [Oxyopes takobius]
MNFYSVAVLLLLALAYNASCTQHAESYEDLDESIDNEVTLNALVNLLELEQPEEEARFRRWPRGPRIKNWTARYHWIGGIPRPWRNKFKAVKKHNH